MDLCRKKSNQAGELQRDQALDRLGELRALGAGGYVPSFCFACAAHGFDERDRIIGYLEKSYEERDWAMCLLSVEPFFDDLRQDAQFINLVERMNFPSATAATGR